MSTIPNGISSDDLKALLATAHIDADSEIEDTSDEPEVKTSKGSYTQSQIEAMTEACDEELFELCPHPIAHKVLVLGILDKMIHWHERTALDKDDAVEAAGWAADAGKLHAIKTLFQNISLGEQDFTC